ncbi:HD domain-containing protein [Patescibacteria group bacterium]|nr:HD domain-containing protein [Patescibacteria group bacterium]
MNEDPQKEPQPNKELIQRFEKKLKDEKGLLFLDSLFADLPELEMYLVGGMVRDVIVRHPTSKDYDFVARNIPLKQLISSLKKYGSVDLEGKNFAVIKFYPKNKLLKEAVDIAIPRTEISKGTGAYRDVNAQADHTLPVNEDLSRRDLTINAIAWDMKNKNIIDPYGGQADLQNKIIRSVGNPRERFQEDYSRMLRAIRFACRFDFKIEDNTWTALREMIMHLNDKAEIKIVDLLKQKIEMETDEDELEKLKQKLEKQIKANPEETTLAYIVPRETIGVEILKSLKENPAMAAKLLDESGALELLMPKTAAMKGCEQPKEFHSEGDVWQHTMMMLEKINSPEFKQIFPDFKLTGEFALGVLLHDAGKPETKTTDENNRIRFNGHAEASAEIARKIGKRFKFKKDTIDRLSFMAKNHMFLMSAREVYTISANKFAKRFIDNPYSKDLLALFYLDCNCSLRADGVADMKNFEDTVKRIKEIQAIRENQPKKIIDGKLIVAKLSLKAPIYQPFTGIVLSVINEMANLGKINSEQEAEQFLDANEQLLLSFKEKFRGTTRPQWDQMAEEIISKVNS